MENSKINYERIIKAQDKKIDKLLIENHKLKKILEWHEKKKNQK